MPDIHTDTDAPEQPKVAAPPPTLKELAVLALERSGGDEDAALDAWEKALTRNHNQLLRWNGRQYIEDAVKAQRNRRLHAEMQVKRQAHREQREHDLTSRKTTETDAVRTFGRALRDSLFDMICNGKLVRDATRADLLAGKLIYDKRAANSAHKAAWFEALAKLLPDDRRTVGDVIDIEQAVAAWQETRGEEDSHE